ncbi:MAG: alpha/beta hydrolase [Clostridiaceae bacterium]|jgi:acetyl esterase/lipase|nr:alpha/beta hydrolase [Clostridiaceae bacterium]
MQDPSYKIPLLAVEKLASVKNKILDLPYCNQSPSQILDIFFPEMGTGPYPVIMHFHGGAFMFGTQRDVNLEPILRGLERGYAVVSVQYRMSHEARFPALIWDAKAAVRFVRANASKYNFNPDKIAAWGPSAGGYIVSMLGVTADNPAFEDLSMGNKHVSSRVQAVVDWCGPCGNFLYMDSDIISNRIGIPDHNHPESPESRLMGAPIETIPELVKMASPCFYANKDIPPFLIQHGEADPTVPVQQSVRFAKALKEKAGSKKVIFESYPGKGHHGEPWYNEKWLTDRVLDFLDEVLKGQV